MHRLILNKLPYATVAVISHNYLIGKKNSWV